MNHGPLKVLGPPSVPCIHVRLSHVSAAQTLILVHVYSLILARMAFLFILSIFTIFTVLILIGSFAHHRTSWNLINSSSQGAGWNLFGLIEFQVFYLNQRYSILATYFNASQFKKIKNSINLAEFIILTESKVFNPIKTVPKYILI